MEYTNEGIKTAFSKYWKENYENLKFYFNGKKIHPTAYYTVSVTGAAKGKFGDDCNFSLTLSFQFQIGCCIAPSNATCIVKVGCDCSTGEPVAQIERIAGNRIDITRHGY